MIDQVVLLFGISPMFYLHPKLKAVEEHAEDEIVHLRGLRKTDCLADQALDARPQRHLFAFQVLRIAFPHFMESGVQMPRVRPPAIGVKAPDPKRHAQRLQLQKRVLFPPPKPGGENVPGAMILSMPQPPRWLFFAHNGPPFIAFGCLHPRQPHAHVRGSPGVQRRGIDRG
jgi:hypothetical protein